VVGHWIGSYSNQYSGKRRGEIMCIMFNKAKLAQRRKQKCLGGTRCVTGLVDEPTRRG
jgi:hypothetical protein